MLISKVIVIFALLTTTGYALKCYILDSGKKGDLGKQGDCPNSKWCVLGYDDAGEYSRGCNDVVYGVDLICDSVGDRCGTPPDIQGVTWPKGATACCCKTDLCNASSSVTNSVMLAVVTLFVLAIVAFK